MHLLSTFFVCLWHTLLRNDFARDKYYTQFLALEEQKQKRKLEKVKMRNVKSTLPKLKESWYINTRRAPYGGWDFREPIPMVIVHLNQIVSGSRTVALDSYLGSLFTFCKTTEQIKATAEYYLTIFYEDTIYTPCLLAWCHNRKLSIADQSTDEDWCAIETYVDIYAKPSRGPSEALQVPYETMERIVATGDPKQCPELFSYCTNPLECHYTAKWYLRMYKSLPPTPQWAVDLEMLYKEIIEPEKGLPW